MKRIVIPLLALAFLFSSRLSAQAVAWDSAYRPNNFVQKVAEFESYPNVTSDLIFLGNSITAGANWPELLGICQARNRGISGDITFGVLQRLDEVIEGKPARVFILIGINDISRNIPDSVIVANYKTIIQRIRSGAPTTKIYVQTLLPVNNEFTQFKNHYNKDEHILYVNSQLQKIATEEKITLIDLHSQFLDANKKLDKRYTLDGLHLTAPGYAKWAAILKPYLTD